MSASQFISDYLPIIGSSFVVYLILILLIRIFGQKQISDLNLQDFVMVLLIAEVTSHAMIKDDTTILGGTLSALTLFVTNKLINIVFYHFPRLRRKFEPQPTLVVINGQMVPDNMKKIQLNPDELQEILRENGHLSLSEVKYAIMEHDGKFSIIESEEGSGGQKPDEKESSAN